MGCRVRAGRMERECLILGVDGLWVRRALRFTSLIELDGGTVLLVSYSSLRGSSPFTPIVFW